MKEETQPCDSSTAHLLSAQGKAETIKGTWLLWNEPLSPLELQV